MTSPTGLALWQAHDVAQARLLDANLARLVLLYTELFKGADLDAEARAYLPLARAVVQSGRAQSAILSRDFYLALRRLEDPKAAALVATLPSAPADVLVETSLRVTGPVATKTSLRTGEVIGAALESGLVQTIGAATRIVEGGGRDAVRHLVSVDGASKGWARRSGGNPCPWCAMLIGRGPVYRSEGTGSFRAHDHCHCKAVPIFGSDSGWTAQSVEYRELYDAAKDHPDKTFAQLYRERYPATPAGAARDLIARIAA